MNESDKAKFFTLKKLLLFLEYSMFNFTLYSNACNWLFRLKDDLSKARSLEYIILIAVSLSIVSGFVIFLMDPNIHTVSDGIWFTWVTLTHVGYGDVVPTSFFGRLMGVALIVIGLGMFALFTASFSAALIGRDLGDVKKEMSNVEIEARSVEREESLVLKELARLHQRLDKLEAHLIENKKD